MATKQELLADLDAAGVEGFTMANSHAELSAAVVNVEAETNARDYARRQYQNAERYDRGRNRPHSVIGA